MTDKTVEELITYVEDDDIANRFAIALYGEWGSGKTYFIENQLRPALKERGYKMVRISLFGVSNREEIYEKLLVAYCHLEDSKAKRVGKVLAKSALATMLGLLRKLGLHLDVSAETALSIVGMDKSLIVLDDMERSKMTADVKGLLGLVNEMVENLHWHVLLVRNEPFKLSGENEGMQAEKVVSRQIEYSPLLGEVYESIVSPKLGSCPQAGFAVDEAIMMGIKASGRINVRSMVRSVPVLKTVLQSDVMQSTSYAAEGKRHALIDVTRYVVLANAGAELESPKQEGYNGDSKNASFEDAMLLRDYMRRESLRDIVFPLYNGQIPSSEMVEQCFENYLESGYPDSPADAEMDERFEEIQTLLYMDDGEVARVAKRLAEAICKHGFGLHWIIDAWSMNKAIRNLGFSEALSDDEVKANMKILIATNPKSAYKILERHREIPDDEDTENERRAYVEELFQYAGDLLRKGSVNGLTGTGEEAIDANIPIKGLMMTLSKLTKGPLPSFESIDPGRVAQCFASGDDVLQGEICQFFCKELPGRINAFEDKRELQCWLKAVKSQVTEIEPTSRMFAFRKSKLVEGLEQLIEGVASWV